MSFEHLKTNCRFGKCFIILIYQVLIKKLKQIQMSCTDTLSLKAFGNLIGILQENYIINSLRIVVSYLNLVVYFPAENGQTHDKKPSRYAARILTCV